MDSGQLVTEVAATLNDPDFVRWTEQDLVGYLNAGCLELCRVKPETNAGQITLSLQSGTKQHIGPKALVLLKVLRNVPSGRAVRMVHGQSLDAILPMWQGMDASQHVREYIVDEHDPKTFWVYPPAQQSINLECSVCLAPSVIGVPASGSPYAPFPLRDEYAETVKAWMLYQAYSVDTGTGAREKAQFYARYFYQLAGAQASNER